MYILRTGARRFYYYTKRLREAYSLAVSNCGNDVLELGASLLMNKENQVNPYFDATTRTISR